MIKKTNNLKKFKKQIKINQMSNNKSNRILNKIDPPLSLVHLVPSFLEPQLAPDCST